MSLLSSLASNVLDLPRLDSSILQSVLSKISGSSKGTLNGGIEYDDQGVPLMFRDSHFASTITTSSDLWYTNVPRYKFLYFIKFVPSSIASTTVNTTNNITDLTSISFIVSQMEKPTVQIETKEFNQYNKKRIIHTGRKYDPLSCDIWDTGNNTFYNFFQEYLNFYIGDSLNSSSTDWRNDTISSKLNNGTNGWGYVIPSKSTQSSANFLDKIQVYEFFGGKYRLFELVNPKISAFKFDNLDSADSHTLSKAKISIVYEGINFVIEDVSILDDEDLINEAKLNKGSFYEPKRLIVSNTQLAFTPQVTFNSPSADTDFITQSTQSGLSSLKDVSNLSSLSGKLGVFGSFTDVVGDIITQNSGTLIQNKILGSNTTNSITRVISSVAGGLF